MRSIQIPWFRAKKCHQAIPRGHNFSSSSAYQPLTINIASQVHPTPVHDNDYHCDRKCYLKPKCTERMHFASSRRRLRLAVPAELRHRASCFEDSPSCSLSRQRHSVKMHAMCLKCAYKQLMKWKTNVTIITNRWIAESRDTRLGGRGGLVLMTTRT